MARRISYTPESFRYLYEGLVFPRRELSLPEERSQGRLLDLFESVGVPEQLDLGNGRTASMRGVETSGCLDITEEADFALLISIVKASKPNGLHVRTKLGLIDYLEQVPKLKVKVVEETSAEAGE